ncbi:hypothetical protein C8A01DRAFT_15203 [Parachaetomium inaequale]|uniref:Uncharacterized protein n=1 Tax=Parachaetomium inaequale TaxID=2588326 RepID=A0AAN6PKZ4_9PEZI|nr:hypothetical protein C8A01DRAFT_15203 [Parachaetomium inaequale]
MASSGLASGAFLTTISGRRCTAVPRVAAASTSASSVATVVTTTSSTSTTSTTSTASTTTTRPTNGLAVAPIAGIDASTEAAEQSSTTSTTSSSLTTRTNPPSGSVRIAQAQDSESGPTARPPPPRPAAPPASDAAPQSFTAFADVSPSQASVAQSSQADASVTAPAADTPVDPSGAAPAETASPDLPQGPVATPLLSTIESPQTPVEPPQTPTDTLAADATGTSSADAALTAVPNLNNNAVQSTVAVAGGVIGGVVAISVLAFFIWWWRRRLQRKRRSTLLTPLDVVPSYDRDEKGGYVISRGSIGPTPVAVKVKAALDHNFKKIRGHIRNRTAPSVNLDRGTSQFIDPAMAHSRANSGVIGAEPATTDRLKGWWSGLGKKFNRRDDNAQEKRAGATQEKKASSSQPDFLTLLNMDDGELDREAQRRRASIARLNGRASSADGFLGGLSLNFGSDDPFSDANAIAHTSAKPAPLAVNQPSPANPFSDTNAIRDPPPAAMSKPTTYVADIRRSRSNSTVVGGGGGRQPSTVYNYTRDSAASLRSMATATTTNQRTKFRSDPFDLERPELLGKSPAVLPTIVSGGSTASSTAATFGSTTTVPSPGPTRPQLARPPARAARTTRAESLSSRYSKYSKYSSGVSALSVEDIVRGGGGGGDDWSDPGPDVGPGSAGGARWWGDGNGAGAAGNGGGGRLSGNSLGSVGKAM